MATEFSYSISNDFNNGEVYTANLVDEITASTITANVVKINTEDDTLIIFFDTDLTSEEETILDGDTTGPAGGLLAAHNPIIADATVAFSKTSLVKTTSTEFITVPGMSGIPIAGQYQITFSGSMDNDSRNKKTEVTIYIDGAEVPSTRRRTFRGRANQTTPFSCVTYTTLDGTQKVEGRWRVDNRSTGIIEERTLLITAI